MASVNWTDLIDRQLQTATGAPFTVVRVSATHVAIRPKGGRRDYALSIQRELEPAVAVYTAGNLPAPTELRRLGVRPVLTSYAWGILKAVVQDRIGVRTVLRAKLQDFVGVWVITDMEDMGEEYWADEPVVMPHPILGQAASARVGQAASPKLGQAASPKVGQAASPELGQWPNISLPASGILTGILPVRRP